MRRWLRPSREAWTTLLELLGLVAVTVGVAMIYVPAGWITGGVLAVGVGALVGMRPGGSR